MTNIAINTSQNVNIQYKVASIGERILACLIDLFILIITMAFLAYIAGKTFREFDISSTSSKVVAYVLMMLPAMTYTLWMESIFNGRTVGKMIVKTRVVRVDGMPVRWSNYLVQWMFRLIDIWFLYGAVGVLGLIFTDKRQRLGNAAAGTMVISTKNMVKIDHTILEEVEENYVPVFHQVTQFSDKDIRLIKDTYQIAQKSYDAETLKMLRNRIEKVTKIESDLNDSQFIEVILKDYNYFTQDF